MRLESYSKLEGQTMCIVQKNFASKLEKRSNHGYYYQTFLTFMRRTQESTMEDEKRSISKSRRIWEETEKMWGIAGPAILMSVSQYSLEFVTSAFVGHLGAFELAAVSIINNLVQGFVYGLM